MGRYLADWPDAEITRLWEDLAKRFAQMGGNSAPRFPAHGRQGHLPADPLGGERRSLSGTPSRASPRARPTAPRLQAIFNGWAEDTGMQLAQLSITLAASVDDVTGPGRRPH